ncbi:MAG: type II secretion system protein [Gammaproteobacteria bacterium]|nr:type II secretion system protein [Gammaproteobacteria bacterium]
MQKVQKGFTLIELIVVMVLLGILGVTALGKFQNMSLTARDATIQGIASEITAGANINYAASLTNLTTAISIDDTSDSTCSVIVPQLLTGGLATDYTATGGGVASSETCTAAGSTYTCSIDHSDTGTTAALATIVCTDG